MLTVFKFEWSAVDNTTLLVSPFGSGVLWSDQSVATSTNCVS